MTTGWLQVLPQLLDIKPLESCAPLGRQDGSQFGPNTTSNDMDWTGGSEGLQLGATHSYQKVSTCCRRGAQAHQLRLFVFLCSSSHSQLPQAQLASACALTLPHLCALLLTTPSTITAGSRGCRQQLRVPQAGQPTTRGGGGPGQPQSMSAALLMLCPTVPDGSEQHGLLHLQIGDPAGQLLKLVPHALTVAPRGLLVALIAPRRIVLQQGAAQAKTSLSGMRDGPPLHVLALHTGKTSQTCDREGALAKVGRVGLQGRRGCRLRLRVETQQSQQADLHLEDCPPPGSSEHTLGLPWTLRG